MIKYKKGNIFDLIYDNKYDVILIGSNCFCKMDDGINLQIAHYFPEVMYADAQTEIGDQNKLGTFLEVNIVRFEQKFIILNCYTQFSYAGSDIERSDYFEYEHFDSILAQVAQKYPTEKIAMPLIGSGHAGGDVNKIIAIIHKHLKHHNVEIALYNSHFVPKQFLSLSNQIVISLDKIKDKIKEKLNFW